VVILEVCGSVADVYALILPQWFLLLVQAGFGFEYVMIISAPRVRAGSSVNRPGLNIAVANISGLRSSVHPLCSYNMTFPGVGSLASEARAESGRLRDCENKVVCRGRIRIDRCLLYIATWVPAHRIYTRKR